MFGREFCHLRDDRLALAHRELREGGAHLVHTLRQWTFGPRGNLVSNVATPDHLSMDNFDPDERFDSKNNHAYTSGIPLATARWCL